MSFFLLSIRISEKTLKFDNISLDKKELHKSKQPINQFRLSKRGSNGSI